MSDAGSKPGRSDAANLVAPPSLIRNVETVTSAPTVVPQPAPFRLDRQPSLTSILSLQTVFQRPSRPPDYKAESEGVAELIRVMGSSPDIILQKLADIALSLCKAHSAGISLLEEHDQRSRFHWNAIAGQWVSHLGGGTPRDFGPCGTVLDCNTTLLFSHPERDFPYLAEMSPLIEEGLLVPFSFGGAPVGTIWVIAHDKTRRFDAEDLRIMTKLGAFAEGAYQTVTLLNAASANNRRLEELTASQELLSSLVASSDDAILVKDLTGTIRSWNDGAERLFGYTAAEALGRPVTILVPPDRLNEEKTIFDTIKNGEHVQAYETVRLHKEGRPVDVSLSVSPVRDAEGRLRGASKIARDIGDIKRAQEQRNLLLREMNHRIKNIFAVVGSIVGLSARFAGSPQEMAAATRQRIDALARAHDLTRPGVTGSMELPATASSLHAVIRTIFQPYSGERTAEREIFIVQGDDIALGGQSVTDFALVINELATNAIKYGALASPSGTVHIGSEVRDGALILTWKELGGPPIELAPEQNGFGSRLINKLVTSMWDGRMTQQWRREGLLLRLSVPTKAFMA
jgi:PAS domain S-box-containing protein